MKDVAERIAEKISDDLGNRSGVGDEWEQIPAHHKEEILRTWAALIREEVANG